MKEALEKDNELEESVKRRGGAGQGSAGDCFTKFVLQVRRAGTNRLDVGKKVYNS